MLGDLRHLAAIGSLSMRVAVARERLREEAASAAAQLERVLERGREGDERARRSIVACCIALAQDDGEPWTLSLAREATAQRLPTLRAMLRDPDPHRAVRPPGRLHDPCTSVMLARIFASISLKVRFSHNRWLPKDRILMNPAPDVVRRLLRGPALQLGDALVIASRRPTSDAIVREIVLSLRWMGRIEVREALVANPFVRPRVALVLLPTLLSTASRALARSGVHPLVSSAAGQRT
jgi:hypothetical protein